MFLLVSVAEDTGLKLTLLVNQKTGFVALWPIWSIISTYYWYRRLHKRVKLK